MTNQPDAPQSVDERLHAVLVEWTKGWFHPSRIDPLKQQLAARNLVVVDAKPVPSASRVEAIAKVLYEFDSDGKPHRMLWEEFLSRYPGTGFLLSARELIAADPLTAVAAQMREALGDDLRALTAEPVPREKTIDKCMKAMAAYDKLEGK